MSTPLDDDMESITANELPGADRLPASDRYQNRDIARPGRYLLWSGEPWTRERNIDPVTIKQFELVETTIGEDGRIAVGTLMTFERPTLLRRWLWRPRGKRRRATTRANRNPFSSPSNG